MRGDRAAELTAGDEFEEIYASVRGDSLRLSFHLHLRDRDVERLLQTLAQALKS